MDMKELFDDFTEYVDNMSNDDIVKSVDNAVKHSANSESLENNSIRPSAEDVGAALKIISDRIRNSNFEKEEKLCKTYGCLYCKHFQREEGYDYEWGWFAFFYYKCKKQPDRNMYDYDNRYNIFDIEPDCSPHFHYDKAKGECPYFERGKNDLIYMSDKEKRKCMNG